jgi:hypothetical protein
MTADAWKVGIGRFLFVGVFIRKQDVDSDDSHPINTGY